jgi:hypothetical protein
MVADIRTVFTTSCNEDFGQVIETQVEEPIVTLPMFCPNGIQELTHLGICKSQHETFPELSRALYILLYIVDLVQSEENVHVSHSNVVPVVEVVEQKRVLECTILLCF